ncbi:MAG: hypothetical protein ACKPEN_08730 [Planktothrix sp.]|uniref:hypothetical protein n=1 Tax=Planktothrix sp. TaxID=3088171 RepID=UPI0038D499C9
MGKYWTTLCQLIIIEIVKNQGLRTVKLENLSTFSSSVPVPSTVEKSRTLNVAENLGNQEKVAKSRAGTFAFFDTTRGTVLPRLSL